MVVIDLIVLLCLYVHVHVVHSYNNNNDNHLINNYRFTFLIITTITLCSILLLDSIVLHVIHVHVCIIIEPYLVVYTTMFMTHCTVHCWFVWHIMSSIHFM